MVTPVGNPATVHVYGPEPPLAVSATDTELLTASPRSAIGAVTLTYEVFGTATLKMNVFIALAPRVSVTVTTVTNRVPAVGVPLITPAVVIDTPGGSPVAVHV